MAFQTALTGIAAQANCAARATVADIARMLRSISNRNHRRDPPIGQPGRDYSRHWTPIRFQLSLISALFSPLRSCLVRPSPLNLLSLSCVLLRRIGDRLYGGVSADA